jgi:hypothetical protein
MISKVTLDMPPVLLEVVLEPVELAAFDVAELAPSFVPEGDAPMTL